MKILKMEKAWSRYNVGEIAGFEDDTAAKLVAAKIAVPHKAKSKAAGKDAGDPPAQGGGKS